MTKLKTNYFYEQYINNPKCLFPANHSAKTKKKSISFEVGISLNEVYTFNVNSEGNESALCRCLILGRRSSVKRYVKPLIYLLLAFIQFILQATSR